MVDSRAGQEIYKISLEHFFVAKKKYIKEGGTF